MTEAMGGRIRVPIEVRLPRADGGAGTPRDAVVSVDDAVGAVGRLVVLGRDFGAVRVERADSGSLVLRRTEAAAAPPTLPLACVAGEAFVDASKPELLSDGALVPLDRLSGEAFELFLADTALCECEILDDGERLFLRACALHERGRRRSMARTGTPATFPVSAARAVLGRSELAVEDLLKLETGALVELDVAPGASLVLELNGEARFGALLVEVDGTRAARIGGYVRRSDDARADGQPHADGTMTRSGSPDPLTPRPPQAGLEFDEADWPELARLLSGDWKKWAVLAFGSFAAPTKAGVAAAMKPDAAAELARAADRLSFADEAAVDAVADGLRKALRAERGRADGRVSGFARARELVDSIGLEYRSELVSRWKKLADEALRAKDYLSALGQVERALALDPRDVDGFARKGSILIAMRDYRGAADACEAAIGLDPWHVRARLGLGVAYAALGRVEEARTALLFASDLDPGNPATWRALAELERRDGSPRAARECAAALARLEMLDVAFLDPDNLPLTVTGSARHAVLRALGSLELNPRSFVAWTGLARELGGRGLAAEARACLDRALALAPDYPPARTLLETSASAAASASALKAARDALDSITESGAREARFDVNRWYRHLFVDYRERDPGRFDCLRFFDADAAFIDLSIRDIALELARCHVVARLRGFRGLRARVDAAPCGFMRKLLRLMLFGAEPSDFERAALLLRDGLLAQADGARDLFRELLERRAPDGRAGGAGDEAARLLVGASALPDPVKAAFFDAIGRADSGGDDPFAMSGIPPAASAAERRSHLDAVFAAKRRELEASYDVVIRAYRRILEGEPWPRFAEELLVIAGLVFDDGFRAELDALSASMAEEVERTDSGIASVRASGFPGAGIAVFLFDTSCRERIRLDDQGRFPLRERDLIRNVMGGQTLARKKDGADSAAFARLAGIGTRLGENGSTIEAARAGAIRVDMDAIGVADKLRIDGNLGPDTGNVMFVGKLLVVEGDVMDGYSVSCSGDVVVRGSVRKAWIRARGDVVIDGSVFAGANVEARGISVSAVRGATLVASGNVVVAHEILDADVAADGTVVVTGERGRIVGGRTRARSGVEAAQIGNALGADTAIETGLPPRLVSDYETLAGSRRELSERIGEMERAMAAPGVGAEVKETLDRRLRSARDDLVRYDEESKRLAGDLRKANDPAATVTARDVLHPDTRIRLGVDGHESVRRTIEGGTMSYDAATGIITLKAPSRAKSARGEHEDDR